MIFWGNGVIYLPNFVLSFWRLGSTAAFGRLLMWLLGALGFGLLEVFWRGFTHWTMLCAGALGLAVIDYIDRETENLGDWGKAWLCALVITALELIIGVAANLYAGLDVWDYSALPLNLLGQICPEYMLIWLALARLMLPLRRRIANSLGEI